VGDSTKNNQPGIVNWSGAEFVCNKSQVAKPNNEMEIQELFKANGKQTNFHARAIGSMYSNVRLVKPFNSNSNKTDAVVLDLEKLSGLLNIKGEYVTFGAATKLSVVFD